MTFLIVIQICFMLSIGFAYSLVLPPIIGGEDANIEDYPYQIFLENVKRKRFCGGSILSEKFIITAAHCVVKANAAQLLVRAGANVSSEGGIVIEAAKVTVHPENDYIINDVAILELSTPLQFSSGINKIQLPGTVELEPNTTVTITGYGVTSYPRRGRRLQVLQVPIVSRDVCNSTYNGLVGEDMICAGIGDKNACKGDSGGPLVYEGILYGVTSWTRLCAKPGYPAVYNNVIHSLPFIKKVTGL